jgi:tetratricopeptide (TPR) repeat protein
VDLRVDDSKNPFAELRRLLNMTHSAELITQANRKAADKDYQGALKLAQDAVAKSPENDNAYVTLASMQLRNNQKAQALATLKKAIELNPANKRQVPKNTNFKDVVNDPEFKQIFGL